MEQTGSLKKVKIALSQQVNDFEGPSGSKKWGKDKVTTKNEPTVNFKGFDWYHIQKEFISRWVLGKEQKNY